MSLSAQRRFGCGSAAVEAIDSHGLSFLSVAQTIHSDKPHAQVPNLNLAYPSPFKPQTCTKRRSALPAFPLSPQTKKSLPHVSRDRLFLSLPSRPYFFPAFFVDFLAAFLAVFFAVFLAVFFAVFTAARAFAATLAFLADLAFFAGLAFLAGFAFFAGFVFFATLLVAAARAAVAGFFAMGLAFTGAFGLVAAGTGIGGGGGGGETGSTGIPAASGAAVPSGFIALVSVVSLSPSSSGSRGVSGSSLFTLNSSFLAWK
jgi:hypothetical protein